MPDAWVGFGELARGFAWGCAWAVTEIADGEARIVGVGGPEGKGVASPVVVVTLLLLSGRLYRRDFGTRTEASKRTVKWCARVAAAFKLRKKRY